MALILGGSGLVAVNVIASATESGNAAVPLGSSGVAATVDCPDLAERLTAVPEAARPEVDPLLAELDAQVATAYQRLQEAARTADDGKLDEAALLDPLKKDRAATIERIAAAIEKAGDRPGGLDTLAECTLRRTEVTPAATASGGGSGSPEGQEDGQEQGQEQGQDGQGEGAEGEDAGGEDTGGAGQEQPGNGGQAGNGPVAADYADIKSVQPSAAEAPEQENASRGSFVTSCGVNAEGRFNSDNLIAAPGVGNGAHHFHDYVGNLDNDAFSSDDDLAAADTTCADKGDKSSYYWPVVRLQNGTAEHDAQSPGGGIEGNAGEIVTPAEVTLTFQGNERDKVVEMPRLLRIITGDAKSFVNGPANANASWSCTGFEDRQLKDKYPLCPSGSDVVRTFTFQSCWDGRNIDSANHRTHMAFAAADGTCPEGFQPIPRLVQRVVYDIDAPSLQDGGKTVPLFAVDSFPEQLHKPVTDHSDFINVFDEGLMREMVDCINSGRTCGAGQGEGPGQGEEPSQEPSATEDPGATAEPEEPGGATEDPGATAEPEEPGGAAEEPGGAAEAPDGQTATASAPAPAPADPGRNDGDDNKGQDDGKSPGQNDGQDIGDTTPPPAKDQGADPAASAEPKSATTPAAAPTATPAEGTDTDTGTEDTAAGSAPAPQTQTQAQARTEPQGGLAETGNSLGLWPAALGGVLFAGGCALLIRSRRRAL